ncbi:MAG TPA: hypothetical protein VEY89_05140, partial [Candidatus Dormibacteraeota bacterium]|nr:hypothetical protein [Candidatus Dormibacteraeota bacterium]
MPQVPLLIGITGHRELRTEEIEPLRGAVRGYLGELRERFPAAPLLVASTLAPGAEILAVEEALALGIECVAILPLPLELYRADFGDELGRFEEILGRCRQRVMCPLQEGLSPSDVSVPGASRSAQYAATSRLIASHAYILLALWDGRVAIDGSAATIAFRLARRAWLDDDVSAPHKELLPDIPPDLVYHIVASSAGGEPAAGMTALQAGYRCSLEGPLESAMTPAAELVAIRTSELNVDLRGYAQTDASVTAPAGALAALAAAPQCVHETAALFDAIDTLAARMRSRVMTTLYLTSALTVAMGIFFLAFSHSDFCLVCRFSIFAFLAGFLALVIVNSVAHRSQWHRRYLEFRAVAEGLRVELFWAVAGVRARGAPPAAHRTMLKQADPGLEWIPNAIRTLSLLVTEVRYAGMPGGIEFAHHRWVGTISDAGARSEQLHYYWQASRQAAAFASFAERAALVSVVIGVGVAATLAVQTLIDSQALYHPLLFSM